MSPSSFLRRSSWHSIVAISLLAPAAACAPGGAEPAGPEPPDDPGDPGNGAAPILLVNECDDPDPVWIWCDDFDTDRMDAYFEHDEAEGNFVRAAAVGVDSTGGLRAHFDEGAEAAGSLKLALGRTVNAYMHPVDEGDEVHDEIHWRFYVRNQEGWQGGGGHKLTRATSIVSPSWAQAMIAHVWFGSPPDQDILVLDPASGVLPGGEDVVTKTYNDFPNLRWLGIVRGHTPFFLGEGGANWHCIEAMVRLNEPGNRDGEFSLWVDGELEASASRLDWRGSVDEYGINAIFIENYWNDGAPKEQERYFDNLVVSPEPIGCLREVVPGEEGGA